MKLKKARVKVSESLENGDTTIHSIQNALRVKGHRIRIRTIRKVLWELRRAGRLLMTEDDSIYQRQYVLK